MVRDMPGHVVVFLVDMPVKHGHILVRHHDGQGLVAVTRCPIPFRCQIKQRTVREHYYRGIRLLLRQIRFEPIEAGITNARSYFLHIIHNREMDVVVVKGIVGFSKKLFVRSPVVQ